MLVLSVTEDERVIIHRDGEVICEVILVQGGTKARIGFAADSSIGIDREPVFIERFSRTTAQNEIADKKSTRPNKPQQP